MPSEANGNQRQDAEVLRDTIRRVFPAETYTGQVTACDGSFTSELDDEEELFEGLRGRKWTEVGQSLIYSQPDGFELLTDRAYRAFVAAWLSCSLDCLDSENEVRNFVLFAFSNTVQRLRALDSEQRLAVRSLLAYFAERESNSSLKDRATEGLENLERLERNLVSFPWLDRSNC